MGRRPIDEEVWARKRPRKDPKTMMKRWKKIRRLL